MKAEGLVVPERADLEYGNDLPNRHDRDKSIAILPFVNMSSDPEQEYFCDGITDEIINSLNHVHDLKVIARTSSFMFKNRSEDIRTIGKTLNVSKVLEGSVRKAGQRVRITSQLIDVVDGAQLWSNRFDRDLEDIFGIQEEISLAIVDQLKVRLLQTERQRVQQGETRNVNAHDLFLKGQHAWYLRTREGMIDSIRYYQNALEVDHHYHLARIGLANAYNSLCDWGIMLASDALPKAKELLTEVLGETKAMPEAYAAAAYHDLCNWDFDGYSRNVEKAIALNGNLPFANHLLTVGGNVFGTFDRGIDGNRKARRVDPLSLIFNFALGHARYLLGQLTVAVDQFYYVLTIDQTFKPAMLFNFYLLCHLKRDDEALHMMLAFIRMSARPHLEDQVRAAFQQGGTNGLLNWLLHHGLVLYERPHNHPFHAAICHALLAQPEQTFKALDTLFEQRSFRLLAFSHDPIIGLYSSDPRFKQLREKIGIE